MRPGGERNHRAGDVDADRVRSSLGRPSRHIARACGEIQHSRPGSHVRRVEQTVREAAGDLADEPVVARRLLLPPCRLEGIEGIRVDLGLTHQHTVLGLSYKSAHGHY